MSKVKIFAIVTLVIIATLTAAYAVFNTKQKAINSNYESE